MKTRGLNTLGALLLVAILCSTVSARTIFVRGNLINGNGNGHGNGSALHPFLDLQQAIDEAADGDTLYLAPGIYSAKPEPFSEDLCGNGEIHRTKVSASRGFLIRDKAILIIGSGVDHTTLITNAGYGVLFDHSRGSIIQNLAITGGKRDSDGNATDAGIIAKFSTVKVQTVTVRDNIDRIDSVVVGIGGIFGRENSELFVHDCQILNNGWDGIALYRGAIAYIADNLISEGRGAGIGITWDAVATVLRNTITDYWKGIGTFGASQAIVKNNLVEDCLGWGIIATGTSYLDASNNNVIHNGNCGLAIWSETCSGRIVNNIVIDNGWREEWVAPQVGLWSNGNYQKFEISNNDIWRNVAGNYRDMPDLTGIDGNISVDPGFLQEDDFHLKLHSPCTDTGSKAITEGDGSISDIGMYGGPAAR